MDLSQYLTSLDGQYRIFDVGRRIRKLDKQQFAQFESLAIPYPFPYLQHAWLVLYISQPNQPENETLWFLKWPLDEQGKLIPYVRDDLVSRLLRLSEKPLVVDGEIEDPLKDNPFSFNPDDVRRANIHAMIHSQLHRKPSSHYETAVNYLKAGTLNKDALNNWQTLGLQGIADVAARMDKHLASLNTCLAHLPSEALLAFAQCMEHHPLPHQLADGVKQRLLTALASDPTEQHNIIAVEAGMRLIGASHNDALRIEIWQAWLASAFAHSVPAVLTFATRNHDDLAFMPDKITDFLVILAKLNGNFNSFVKIVADLLFLPGTRNLLLQALRSEQRPEILGQAMQALLTSKQDSKQS